MAWRTREGNPYCRILKELLEKLMIGFAMFNSKILTLCAISLWIHICYTEHERIYR